MVRISAPPSKRLHRTRSRPLKRGVVLLSISGKLPKITVMKNASKLTAIFLVLWLILSFHSIYVFSQTQSNNSSRRIYKFINGQWFNGKSFQRQNFEEVHKNGCPMEERC